MNFPHLIWSHNSFENWQKSYYQAIGRLNIQIKWNQQHNQLPQSFKTIFKYYQVYKLTVHCSWYLHFSWVSLGSWLKEFAREERRRSFQNWWASTCYLYFSWLKYRMGKKKLSSSAFKSKYFWRIPLNFSSQSTFVRDAPCLKKLWLQGLCWVLK